MRRVGAQSAGQAQGSAGAAPAQAQDDDKGQQLGADPSWTNETTHHGQMKSKFPRCFYLAPGQRQAGWAFNSIVLIAALL